jgi:hypothetical protein
VQPVPLGRFNNGLTWSVACTLHAARCKPHAARQLLPCDARQPRLSLATIAHSNRLRILSNTSSMSSVSMGSSLLSISPSTTILNSRAHSPQQTSIKPLSHNLPSELRRQHAGTPNSRSANCVSRTGTSCACRQNTISRYYLRRYNSHPGSSSNGHSLSANLAGLQKARNFPT